jgi:4-amino-4-deoxy-L-arabinose transferase-like glycosyltransferase
MMAKGLVGVVVAGATLGLVLLLCGRSSFLQVRWWPALAVALAVVLAWHLVSVLAFFSVSPARLEHYSVPALPAVGLLVGWWWAEATEGKAGSAPSGGGRIPDPETVGWPSSQTWWRHRSARAAPTGRQVASALLAPGKADPA